MTHSLDAVAPLPTDESLKAMLSRWENGHLAPDDANRMLLCLAFQINESDLAARVLNGSDERAASWPRYQ